MVNKAALGAIAVVVIGVVGVGMLVGTVFSGDAGPADDNGGGAEGSATNATATQTAATASPTPGATNGDERTPMLPRRFESTEVADNVSRLINEAREREGLGRLDAGGNTADDLTEMAAGHSLNMADSGYVGHNVSGTDMSQRYEEHGLSEQCKHGDGTNIYDPGNTDRFEVIGVGSIGQYHELDGNRTFIENESMAAQVVVEDWFDDRENRERLTTEWFERVGVGVEITRRSAVYVTVDLCS